MNALDKINFRRAEQVFAIANTPLFLLRELRPEPVVREIASVGNGEIIFKALKRSIRRKPKNLRDAVRPYAYLIALSFLSDRTHLQQAATLDASNFGWYSYIANVLLKAYTPTSIHNIEVQGQLTAS